MSTNTQYGTVRPHKIEYLPDCAGGGTIEQLAWFIYRNTIFVDNPVESREKPKSLITNMTAQAQQSTTRYDRGVIAQPLHQGDTTCFPPEYKMERNWRQVSAEYLRAGFPDPEWETKMLLDIKERLVNLGTTLVEYRQTTRLFRDTAIGMRDAWRSFKKGKFLRRRLTTCDVASAELIYSYGVEPLVNDLYDSVVALQSAMVKPIVRRFHTRVSDSTHYQTSAADGKFTGWTRTSKRAIAHVHVKARESSFTLGNLAENAWEIVPFSFVVDWTFSIGDYLSALDALEGVSKVEGSLTTKQKAFQEHVPPEVLDDGWLVERPARVVYHSHERTLFDENSMQPRAPSWDPSKSWRAVLHGLSLLRALNQGCDRKLRIR